jgi:hypothetical protein
MGNINIKSGKEVKTGYKNVIPINVIVLLLIGGSLFLSWGDFNVGSSYGGYGSFANISSSGFSIGIYTFTWPFIVIWGIAFLFAVLNKVTLLGSISIVGVFISIWILIVLNNMGVSVSFSGNGKASTNFDISQLAYIPVLGFFCLLFNFSVKQVKKEALIKDIKEDDYNGVVAQAERKISIERIVDEFDEKNKNHLCDKSKLQIVVVLNFLIVLGLTCIGILYRHEGSFATAFVLIICIIVLGIGVFANRILIKEDLFFRILITTVLTTIFFSIQIYRLFDIAYVYEVKPYEVLYI